MNYKMIIFSGKKIYWLVWEERIMMKAKKSGYKDWVIGKIKWPTSFDEENEDHVALRKMNDEAYMDLITNIDCETDTGKFFFGLVRASKSKEFENGNAAVAYHKLKKKYKPSTSVALMKIEGSYQNAILRNDMDPDVFITYLEGLIEHLNDAKAPISEEKFIRDVLNKVDHEYISVVEQLEEKLENLTIEEVRKKLRVKFERIKLRDEKDNF